MKWTKDFSHIEGAQYKSGEFEIERVEKGGEWHLFVWEGERREWIMTYQTLREAKADAPRFGG